MLCPLISASVPTRAQKRIRWRDFGGVLIIIFTPATIPLLLSSFKPGGNQMPIQIGLTPREAARVLGVRLDLRL